MKRRWIIRMLVVLPMVLCVVGWGWSLTHWGEVSWRRNGFQMSWQTSWGKVVLQGVWFKGPADDAWGGSTESLEYKGIWPVTNAKRKIFGGLGYTFDAQAGYTRKEMDIPYWLLMVVFAVPLAVVWRKTRFRKAGGAFPVEAGGGNRK